MRRYIMALFSCMSLFFFASCSCSVNPTNYESIGTAVMQANRLLIIKYGDTIPDNLSGDEYRNNLRIPNEILFKKLQPYKIEIIKIKNKFIVNVFDNEKWILSDWSGSESRIDCWKYKDDCSLDSLITQ